MTLHPIRRAYQRGQSDARTAAHDFLTAQADLYVGRNIPNDKHRRRTLRLAAQRLKDQRGPGVTS